MNRKPGTRPTYAPTGWFFAIILSLTGIGCGDGDGGLAPPEPHLHHVRGVVQSFLSGEPLPDATVEVRELVFGADPKLISSGVTNVAGEFELPYWDDAGDDCYGGYVAAAHDHYAGNAISLCPVPVADVVLKLNPVEKTVAAVPAAATVSVGGNLVFVSDVLYWDDTRRTGTVAYQWKIYAGSECGTITAERTAQATFTAPSSMPSGSCDIAPPGHVWIYYSLDFVFWAAQKADITLQP